MFYTRQFAQVDTDLRHGRHLSRQDFQTYEFITQNYDDLARFYGTYHSRLVQHPDGFFFLLPRGDLIPSRALPGSAMHLGQFIALKCRDPDLTRTDGRISVAGLLADLETTIPVETLSRVYGRKQKEVLSGERINEEIRRALRLLDDLQFIRVEGGDIVPLEAITRFMELSRHGNSPTDSAALALKLTRGVLVAGDEDEGVAGEEPDDGRETQ